MPRRINEDGPYWMALRKAAVNTIEFALEQAGSIRGAARLLRVSESFLIEKVNELGLPKPRPDAHNKNATKVDWRKRAKRAEARLKKTGGSEEETPEETSKAAAIAQAQKEGTVEVPAVPKGPPVGGVT